MAIRPRTAMAPKVPQKMTLRCVCLRQVAGDQADDEGIVARQHQVDQDDGEQGRQEGGRKEFRLHDKSPTKGRTEARRLSSELDAAPCRSRGCGAERRTFCASAPPPAARRGRRRAGRRRAGAAAGARSRSASTENSPPRSNRPNSQAGLAEQRRIDGIAERHQDHEDHHRGHEQLAAGRGGPHGVVGAIGMADQQHDLADYLRCRGVAISEQTSVVGHLRLELQPPQAQRIADRR